MLFSTITAITMAITAAQVSSVLTTAGTVLCAVQTAKDAVESHRK